MPSLTSQLIVSLIDKVSGPAKGAAASLKGVDAAAKSIGTAGAKNAQNLVTQLDKIAAAKKRLSEPFKGLDLANEFKGLRLTSRELQLVTKDFEALRGAMRGMKASDALGIFGTWKSRTVADLREMRAEMAATEKAQQRMSRSWRGGMRFAAGAAGLGGAAYTTQRGIRGSIRATAEYEREGGRAYLAGMTPAETIRAQAMAREASRRYPSIDAAQTMERLRSLRSFTGDFDKGAKLLDDQMQALTVLQSVKGKDAAMDQMQQFMRGMDVLGKNEDPKVVGQLTNAYIKALGVDPDLNMGQFSQFARKSKAAGAALSNDFLGSIVPTFMQDMGGPELGTALGTEVSQTVAGRGTVKSKAYMSRAGLRDRKGQMVDADLLLSNPYEWINKHAPDAMRRMKLDPAKEGDVTKFMSEAFSAQTVSNLFGKFITQREQAERNKKLYAGAPDMAESASKLREKDPFVAAEGFMAQLRNFASGLAEGPLQTAVPMLNSFTDAIARLTDTLQKNPDLATKAGWGAAAAGTAAGGAATWLLGKKALNMFGIGGGATTMQGVAGQGTAAAAPSAAGRVLGSLGRAGSATLGALFGSALNPNRVMWTPELIEMQKQHDAARAAATAAKAKPAGLPNPGRVSAWDEQYRRDTARPAMQAASAPSLDDVWTKGAESVKHLDVSAEAAAAAQRSTAAYKSNVEAGLQGVDAIIQAGVARWMGYFQQLNSVTISPKVNMPSPPSGGAPAAAATPQKSSSIDMLNAKHAAYSDAVNFGTV